MMPQMPKQAQDMEQLRKRYLELERRRITAEANLKTSSEQLEQLKAQARELYQTDDLDQLKAKLETMKKANEERRAEYQRHLDEIEGKLAEVERHYQQLKGAERS